MERRPSRSTLALGHDAETRIAALYATHGFVLLGRNIRVGRLELDLVLQRRSLVVVCEVKHRSSADYGHPAVAVDRLKRERVRRAAARWLEEQEGVASIRFDVATVLGDPERGRIELFANAF